MKLLNPRKTALRADGMNTNGNVLLSDSFLALGEIRLLGVNISGTVEFTGGKFCNSTGDALNLDRAAITGGVFLNDNFLSRGTVRILGAKISGNLECSNGRFRNSGNTALILDGINIGGDVFLDDGISTRGAVHLQGATIAGDLACRAGNFHNPGGIAFSFGGASIHGSVLLNNGFVAFGEVRLPGTNIKGDFDCSGAIFRNPIGNALCFDGATVGGDVTLSDGFRAWGEVRLPGVNITGDLVCRNGSFVNGSRSKTNSGSTQENYAIYASCAKIFGRVFLDGSFLSIGIVYFRSAEILRHFNCTEGRFLYKRGDAINAFCCTFKDSLMLTPSRVCGKIDLCRASIANDLTMTGATALQSCDLDLSGARVGRLCDSQDSWPAKNDRGRKGTLNLTGLTYDHIEHGSPNTPSARVQWIEKGSCGFQPQPYEQLADFFNKAGHNKYAKKIRIAKELARQKSFKPGSRRLWWFLKQWVVGYGFRPDYALGWLGLVILIGWLIFAFGHKGMTQTVSYNLKATDTQNTTATLIASDYPQFRPFVYSIDVALPIVDLQQEHYWMPNSHHKGDGVPWHESGWWLWGTNWAEVLLGWFLASMGIAGATGIIRKD